ncbi:CLC_0170 family protein [Paenibacillus cremeus]|uniref:CLC_0170 family protein n=1 Tax=Paenibacillus cremeus TaxID=2163881 RepID=UPI0037043B79
MFSIFSVGYINSTICLLIITGLFILFIDVRKYKSMNMRKETNAAKLLAWLNICGGAAAWIGNWIYQNYY